MFEPGDGQGGGARAWRRRPVWESDLHTRYRTGGEREAASCIETRRK